MVQIDLFLIKFKVHKEFSFVTLIIGRNFNKRLVHADLMAVMAPKS